MSNILAYTEQAILCPLLVLISLLLPPMIVVSGRRVGLVAIFTNIPLTNNKVNGGKLIMTGHQARFEGIRNHKLKNEEDMIMTEHENIEPKLFETIPESEQVQLKEQIGNLKFLDPIDQESEIKKLSKKHGVSITAIRDQLKIHNKVVPPHTNIVTKVEPYNGKVAGLDIFEEILEILNRYMILPKSTAIPIALWILLTYCYQSFRILPILAITSPEKRCGKTTLLEIIQGLANKALMASNISTAAVYRVIEKYSPTLIIDEADTSLPGNHELRGILNSGHTKASSHVIRVNPDTMEPEKFGTFNPKVIGMIGKLPDTLHDRAVNIPLRRKLPNEKTCKLENDLEEVNHITRQKCERWRLDNADKLCEVKPDIPAIKNDRAADNWMPLLTLAKVIGEDCFEMTLNAMRTMLNEAVEDDSIGTTLLFDIRTVFETYGHNRIFSEDLVNRLIYIEESPWGECGKNGKALTPTKLAALLKVFGLRSKNIRIGEVVRKGYVLDQFNDAFARYLPDNHPTKSATPLHFHNNSYIGGTPSATPI